MIPVYRPTIKRKDMDNVLTCMVNDNIGPGAVSEEFENMLSQFIGRMGGAAFSSYYMALMIAIEALELEPGTPVIVSALSPFLYLHILKEQNLKPIVVDVDLHSGIIGSKEIQPAIDESQPRAGAILLHYTNGIIPDIEQILKFEIPLIEDISHAFATSRDGKKAGSWGDLTVCSLQQEHIITTAEGGFVLSDDKKYLAKLKAVRDLLKENLMITNLNAALGVIQLRELESFIERRLSIYNSYKQAIHTTRNKIFLQEIEIQRVPHSFPVILEGNIKEVQKYCRKKNIDTLPAFPNSIVACDESVENRCPNAKNLLMRTLLFPLYPMLSNENVKLITRVLATLP